MTVNPSEASGLEGCPLLTGKEPHEREVGIDLENSEPAHCPDASKIGNVELETPLIEHILPGAVYLAQQGNAGPAHGSNPFGSLLAMYIVIDDPETGVIVKLAGEVHLDPATGRLSATFNENPQLPFSDMKLDFFGGERAPLATPMTCGTYTTTSVLEPWSHEAPGEVGTPDAKPSSEFQITSAPGGGACAAPGFAPGLVAGTTNNHAGSYSPFTTLLTRKDGEQRFKSVAVTLPKGVSGMISKVPRCDEADADAGTCPAATQIGHVVVQAGVGNEPVTLPEAGKQEDPVYLTEPYEGAPFGLSIVVHPEAGPFDLADGAGTAAERPIVVRARLEVDPHTAQVSVVTDASGPYAMPTILQGIPVDVKSVYVVVDRPEFTFNPTSCEPMATTGTIGSAEGASAAVSSRFQAASCEGQEFAPKFRASTIAKSSRKDGAELQVKVSYPKQGEANIGKAKVSLPKALPSRLSTLNLACAAAQFEANPAGCPAASDVGTATAVTPVLSSPLRGPAYFVSHGGAKFPELIMVLQGEGITIDLAGETFIKHGVTTTTLNAVPDEPVSSFKLTLPEGEYSALAAPGGKLCQRKLVMPTILTGQNGKMLEQKTHIAVRGCSKHMSIVSHKVKRRRLTLRVYAPSGGRLKASGRGLSSKTKRARGRGALTFRLHEKMAGRLRTSVHVSFTPKHGKSRKGQAESVRVRFRR